MLNTLNVNLNTDLKVTRVPDLGIKIKSQDINNNLFILRFTDKGKAIELDETYTVEILTKFEKSKSHRLTSATVYRDYARWEFDTSFITQDEKVTNYVYVRKSGSLVVSADANAFSFDVGLSEIDKDAGRVAEVYDENYQKHLDEFKDNVNFEEIAQAEQARKDAEILRQESYDAKVDTAIVEADVVSKVDNKVTELTPQISNLTAQLAQTQHIYLSAMGVSHTKTATENTSIIKQAVAMAVSDGREIVIPSTPDGQFIDINESIIVNGAPITISGYGRTSKIRQLTFAQSCFSLESVGQKVRDISVYGGEFNGSGQGVRSAHYSGVHVMADKAVVKGIYGNDIPVIVRVSDEVGIVNDVIVEDIESGENVSFNLLGTGTRNLYYDNIRGSYKRFNNVAPPPHLIYFSEDRPNYNITGGKAFAYDGEVSYAFQFKGMVGGRIDFLYSERCEGALHLMYAEDLSIGEVRSIKDRHEPTQGQGALAVHAESTNIEIGKVDIEMESNGKPVLFIADNGSIKELNVISNHPTISTGSEDVDIRGNNIRIFKPNVKNIGAGGASSSIRLSESQGTIIDNPTTSGNQDGISISSTSVGSIITNYKPTQQTECDKKIINVTLSNKIFSGDIPDERSKLLAFDDFHTLTYGTTYNVSSVTSSGDRWLGNPVEQMYVDVVKGQSYMVSSQVAGAKKWVDVGTANLVLEAKITHKDLESLVFRVIDMTTFLGAMIISNKAVIFEYVGGGIANYSALNVLASVDFVPQQGRRYYQKVDVYGDQVDYYINDKHMCSATLDSVIMAKYGDVTTHGILGRGTPSGTFEEIRWISNS